MKRNKFHKVIGFVGLIVSILSLVSCGNKSWKFGNLEYHYVHCIVSGECYEVKEWHNDEIGIEVDTKDYGSLYFSEGTYIMIEDKCPICK